MFGYHGRYCSIELATGSHQEYSLDEDTARRYVGGAGLATRWLLDHTPAGVAPLGPENALVLATCPLVDSGVTTTAKAAFAARSPQTGFLGESLISSHFAITCKRTGWDGFVLQGRCRELSILIIDEDRLRIVPAADLAGSTASETEERVRAQLGRGYQVAAIGPAGETGVRYATISHDGRHAGRTGMGAVMGSKNLKAIAVRGERRAPIADADAVRAIADRLRKRSLGPDTSKYRLLGTAANMLTFDRMGVLPARNFQQATFGAASELSGEGMAAERTRERSGCVSCTIGCEHRFVPAAGEGAIRAEYESLFALGPLLGIANPATVLRLVRAADEAGLDTLSLGGTLAWAMESAEKGLLSGMPGFGDSDGLLELVDRIAVRADPLADLLAGGSAHAAAQLGQGSEGWAMQIKGLELPGYEPRGLKTLALGLATGARGACHNRSGAYEADFASGSDRLRNDLPRGREAVESEDRAAVMDSLVVCKFLRKCFDDFYGETAELLGALTGWDLEPGEMRSIGSRIVTLKRRYNQREGANRAHDTLPARLLTEPVADGPGAGAGITQTELDRMLDDYYTARGWNLNGTVPDGVEG